MAAAFAVFGALSCTYGEPLRSPGSGGARWIRLESEHFTLLTDLERVAAESTVHDLEDGVDAIAQIAFEHPKIAVEPALVVVFRNAYEFHKFLPPLMDGVFVPRAPYDPEGPRLVVAYGELTEQTRCLFFHELTHDLVHVNFGPAPPWFDEGLAEYYGSVRVKGDDVLVGEAAQHVTFHGGSDYLSFRNPAGVAYVAIPIRAVPSATELMHMNRAALYAQGMHAPLGVVALRKITNYAASWALVHMLLDGPASYQRRYESFVRLAKSGQSLEAAFARAFGDLTPRQLDDDFRLYLAKREIGVWRAPYTRPPARPALTERYLTDAEVHLLWAELAPWTGPRASFAARELDEASKSAPGWLDATYYRGLFSYVRGDLKDAETKVQSALTAAPEDPRFLLGLLLIAIGRQHGDVTKDPRILDVALRLARVARSASELNDAADTLRQFSRPGDALPLAERAVALVPFDSAILDTLANVLFDLGRVEQAVDVQTRAVAFLDEQPPDHRGYEERLARYKAAAPR